jgi:hypothetical protein
MFFEARAGRIHLLILRQARSLPFSTCALGCNGASSRCRVVPSVMLAGSSELYRSACGSSPVLCTGGGIVDCLAPRSRLSALTMSATPLPINANAGMKSHISAPMVPLVKKIPAMTSSKAKPSETRVIPRARFGRRLHLIASSTRLARSLGKRPFSACGTRLRLAPHERQNLASWTFCVAHLGQYIAHSHRISSSCHRRIRSIARVFNVTASPDNVIAFTVYLCIDKDSWWGRVVAWFVQ